MTTMVGFDFELIMHLDFDIEEPCEQDSCDKAATWKLHLTCCGNPYYFCDGHKDRNEYLLVATRFEMHCRKCNTQPTSLLGTERIKS